MSMRKESSPVMFIAIPGTGKVYPMWAPGYLFLEVYTKNAFAITQKITSDSLCTHVLSFSMNKNGIKSIESCLYVYNYQEASQ